MKLNNREISAIADKVHNELSNEYTIELQREIHEYIPSAKYINTQKLIEKALNISKEYNQLLQRWGEIRRELNLGCYYDLDNIERDSDKILENIILKERPIKNVPNKDNIVNDIIIANIDPEFNVDNFIKEAIEKWKISL